MAINPIPPVSHRFAIGRVNTPGDQAARVVAPAQAARPRPNAQLLQAEQAGRETAALLSTLPGPNLSFLQPPALPPAFAAAARFTAGPGQRLNVPLLETMQTGRETSALLSSLQGPNQRAFPAPTPPAFAAGQGAVTGAGNMAAPGGPGAALPRSGVQLLETEQAGRTTSTLLSSLMGSGPAGGVFGTSPFARPTVGEVSGSALSTMRTAEQVLQDVGTAAPSAQNMRIANEAYQMEARAQRDFATQRAAGRPGTWEWFA